MSAEGRKLAQLASNNDKLATVLTADLIELRDKTDKELRRVHICLRRKVPGTAQ